MRSVTKTPDSGFLGKDASLLTPGDISKGLVGLRYFNPSAQWRQYTKIIIEPVTFWGDDTTKVKPPDQQALATWSLTTSGAGVVTISNCCANSFSRAPLK